MSERAGNGDMNSEGATMASDLGFQLPEGPIYRSTLATDYTAICVARYQAAPLPG